MKPFVFAARLLLTAGDGAMILERDLAKAGEAGAATAARLREVVEGERLASADGE